MSREAFPDADTWLTDNLTDVGELVGSAEIQAMLGVSRQRVQQLTQLATFPEPVARLKMGAVWRAAEVDEWARARGRSVQELDDEA